MADDTTPDTQPEDQPERPETLLNIPATGDLEVTDEQTGETLLALDGSASQSVLARLDASTGATCPPVRSC